MIVIHDQADVPSAGHDTICLANRVPLRRMGFIPSDCTDRSMRGGAT
jgi:hypothetical protein